MRPEATPRIGGLVLRGLRRRCPRCSSEAFESWFRMRDHCPRCGLEFQREPGYWVGAVIINTIVVFATFVGTFLLLVLLTWPDVPWALVMGITIVANAVIPVVFYPVSKTTWLALELSWHPLEKAELEAASKRAADPAFREGA